MNTDAAALFPEANQDAHQPRTFLREPDKTNAIEIQQS
jgi:hypothetical protein